MFKNIDKYHISNLADQTTNIPEPSKFKAHRFCVAPMLDWTDRHCRYFHRLLTRRALLYTEMVTTGALIYGDRERFLQFDPAENPVAFQLGGSSPEELAVCAKMIEDHGYDEVNLNVGCPSDRVQNGRFGACLMAEPQLVADCVAAMRDKVSIPVTVKSRIGIDDRDSYEELVHFVAAVAGAGCDTFIIHARKAWLKGLSPKQNREVPPLRYDVVFQLKNEFPDLRIVLNGGIASLSQAEEILTRVDGVMMGREAYHNPYLLAEVDRRIFGETSVPVVSREEILERLIPYVQRQLKAGTRLHSVSRHVLGLFHGAAGARSWRRHISENAVKRGADETVLLEALKFTLQ
jgi:tRNA-dihydrouridine synthase A